MKLLNAQNPVETQKTKRTKEPHILDVLGKNFVYDTNSMALWEIAQDVMKSLDVNSICTDDAPFWGLSWTPEHKNYIVFQATYACNLACHYCFVRHHYPDHTNSMNLQTAVDAIKKFQPNWKKTGFHLGFFGGEPLMNWEFIYKTVEWCKEKAKAESEDCSRQCTWHITTNGTLITEEIAEYLAENNFSLIISLDGSEEDHNNARPYAGENKSNSWRDTMRGLEFVYGAYKKAGRQNPVTLRSTFDKNGCELVNRLKMLNQLMYDGKAGHVSVEPSCLAESCARSTFEGLQEDEIYAKFQPEYFAAAKWFLDELNAGRKPSFHHFEMPIQRIFDREPAPTECGAGKGYLSVGPGGKVAACHREHESIVGNFYSGLDQTRLAAWEDNRYFNRIGCNDCWMRNICGGGCRCNSALVYKNLWQPSKIECIFKDMQTKAVFWLLSEMTDDQKKRYSKRYRQQQEYYEQVESDRVCSDPNNCKPCREKLQRENAGHRPQMKKQAQVCGLTFCEGDNCPFEKCGPQTPDAFSKGLAKLNARRS